jgi:hypothetical protein
MRKKIRLISGLFMSAAIWLVAHLAWAQEFGLNEVNNGLNGSLPGAGTDLRTIIGRIIQLVLSFLAALAVIIIIYAGFKWMTSGGDEGKIDEAKKTLRNAVIGLVIIMASWAIVTFVLMQLSGILGGNGNGNNPGGEGTLPGGGLSAMGACTVDSFYPASDQNDVPRNTAIMITFKEELKLDSVCVNTSGSSCACDNAGCNKLNPLAVNLYKTDLGNACNNNSCSDPNTNVTDVIVAVPSNNKTLVLTPVSYLGSPTQSTSYSIRFTSNIKNIDGGSLFQNCYNNYTEWKFTVSSNLDLTPPIVKESGVFPRPDNIQDAAEQITPPVAATAAINFNDCPQIYSAAAIENISPSSATVELDYQGEISQFKVAVPQDASDVAQLFDGYTNALLGVATFNQNNEVIFPNYLSLQAASHPSGSVWTINISPEQLADTLTVGAQVYTFAANGLNNNILVPTVCDHNVVAANTEAKLSGNSDVNVSHSGFLINLSAAVAGSDGNNLVLQTTNNTALSLTPFSGGQDQEVITQINDKRDNPMNSVIQINFNEAVNPTTVSGPANNVANYLRVVNAATSSLANAACVENSDCRSYECANNICVGDYLDGKFLLSNGYKTVEFLSNSECGLNGCGEKIYCLPANSHLAVQLVAADLKTCASGGECSPFVPYKNCSSTPLGYNTCQNDQNQNYPTATSSLNGIVDAAMNSLNGDRGGAADGPKYFYSDNYTPFYHPEYNIGKKDNFLWSFYVNDQIMSGSPLITTISPTQSQSSLGLADPVVISFNTLMMNSTLLTGSALVENGTSTVRHKLINLSSIAPSPLGYWVLNDNIDTEPFDGVPDLTISRINHSPFQQSFSYKAQVGSGVKDIYQNCYKPSAGPNCSATDSLPSCCFGTAVDTLNADGNCP